MTKPWGYDNDQRWILHVVNDDVVGPASVVRDLSHHLGFSHVSYKLSVRPSCPYPGSVYGFDSPESGF